MKNIKNYGFTLAEVLITLTIIGIVAAITIPVLSQNANERATVTALKKAFSVLTNAYNLAVQENGTPDNWGNTASYAPLLQLKPYLNVNKDCLNGSQGCFPPGVNYLYLTAAWGGIGIMDNISDPKLRLADGTIITGADVWPSCNHANGTSQALQNVCGQINVDINGYKGPNQFGMDMFVFWVTKYGLIPAGTQPETLWRSFPATCKNKDAGMGDGCTAWIIYNENMDYLHCNDLDWGVKTKCN